MAKKANYIIALPQSADVLVPNETYVLVKRFSAKEEPRRVVASVYDHNKFSQYNAVGFENHLNYYHQDGRGLLPVLARGLSVYLNSTLLDEFFRHFSGHTQVNATDLRMLRYPTTTELEHLGNAVGEEYPTQERIDELIAGLFGERGADPIRAKKKISDAVTILRSLGMPRGMQRERSALTLLALTRVTPGLAWSDAQAPEVAVPAMMSFFAEHYGKQYAPNTREELRRYTLQNFLDAGLISAVGSGLKATYQIAPHVLPVIQAFRTKTQLASHPVQNK